MKLAMAIMLGLSACMTAEASPAELKKDMHFLSARKMLLKDKWIPVNVHLHDNYALIGVEHELSSNKINEFESCTIDYSNCIMHYKRLDQCLTVYTIGEHPNIMKIVSWSDACPGSTSPSPSSKQ